jgi:hypothetical protein
VPGSPGAGAFDDVGAERDHAGVEVAVDPVRRGHIEQVEPGPFRDAQEQVAVVEVTEDEPGEVAHEHRVEPLGSHEG